MKNDPETPLNLPSLAKNLEMVCNVLRKHMAPKEDEVIQDMNEEVPWKYVYLLAL